MAMGPERSKALHNFSMPCLKWGNQRFLRCVKVNTENDDPSSQSSSQQHNDIDAVREKLMIDLKVAADNLKVSIFDEANHQRPWNLRTRRAATFNQKHHATTNQPVADSVAKHVVMPTENNNNKKRKMDDERVKFSVSLSKEEVEQDFWALVGTRPPRRSKKRPRTVQRQLDTIFPGLWLTEVTPESYKVPDVPE